ncbi:MAG: altronate dehydratase family protein [Spirosomataceae bacterium]
MKRQVLKIHPNDNVIVALTDLKKGETTSLDGVLFELQDDIPAKHKFAEHDFAAGDQIYMYGVLVGKAQQAIPKGGWINTFNVKHSAQAYSGRQANLNWHKPDVSKFENRTFMGYHRADGRVGTANYWVVVPMVFCENQNVGVIREALLKELGYTPANQYQSYTKSLITAYQNGVNLTEFDYQEAPTAQGASSKSLLFPNVDGIKFLTHEGGCGGTRDDAQTLCRLLAGYITHPNVAGATVLSLGCQNAQVKILQDAIAAIDPQFSKPLYIFDQQAIGNEDDMLRQAIRQTFIGLTLANQCTRQPASLKHINLGVECGGSDGFSGISANPAVGYCADLLATLGGKVMLAEFPELCGVEQELINRCVTEEIASKFMTIQTAYARRAEAVGSGFDMNPSPGNIKDGLITDAIKSAGAAKKGGTSPVTDVLDYTEQAKEAGLNLLCTPGNDGECTTGLAGSGANVIMFTTGLGNPMGNPVCPVLKISSNSRLAQRMGDIIDIDAGLVITGEKTIEEMGEDLLEICIATASGEYIPKAVSLGHDDFIPWKRGVSL